MLESITQFLASKSKKKPATQMTRLAPCPSRQPPPEARSQRFGFTKVFRWPVPADQTPKPIAVEVVGSFSEWRKIPLSYDAPTKTWQLILRDIQGNHTHRYMMLVDGKPSYDETCDGLALPQTPQEETYQITTAKGPRVMLMFSQTK